MIVAKKRVAFYETRRKVFDLHRLQQVRPIISYADIIVQETRNKQITDDKYHTQTNSNNGNILLRPTKYYDDT